MNDNKEYYSYLFDESLSEEDKIVDILINGIGVKGEKINE
ncbi:MAG: hypothetical protein ACJAX4_000993 [Clostridium sp.]|jgi:hypothetical protein